MGAISARAVINVRAASLLKMTMPEHLPGWVPGLCGAALALLLPVGGVAAEGSFSSDAYACQWVDVVSPQGTSVFGIEDMALDVPNGRVLLSAYDRFAVAAAFELGTPPPAGALYTVETSAVVAASAKPSGAALAVQPVLMDAGVFDVDLSTLRPHGIGLTGEGLAGDGGTNRLAVINRTNVDASSYAAELLIFDVSADQLTLVGRGQGDAFCRANDVAFVDADTAFFTFDHSSCDASGVWMERIFSPYRSGIRQIQVNDEGKLGAVTLIDDASFANGIAFDADHDQVLMTASRDSEMRVYELSKATKNEKGAGTLAPEPLHREVLLNGSPDNVNVTADGHAIVAVHPSSFNLFLYTNGFGDLPNSRVLVVEPDGTVFTIVDTGADGLPDAQVEAASRHVPGAATSALEVEGTIVVSSAWDSGLGICRPR